MFRISTIGRSAQNEAGSHDPTSFSACRRATTTLSCFNSDERGTVALTFGLLTIIMVTLIGASLDMSRWMQARRITLEGIDAAVLAGIKQYQVTSDPAAALLTAQATYNYAKSTRPGLPKDVDTISFVLSSDHTSMTATGNVSFTMPFLTLAGVGSMPLLRTDDAKSDFAIAKTSLSGTNTGTNLEVSVMIDITGSMGESDNSGSTKIATVRTAAANLVDIVVWADQSNYTSKVAVVPFSEAVNLGTSALADLARGTINWGNTSSTPGSQYYKPSNRGSTYAVSSTCVTERLGADKYTDAAPSTSPVGRQYSPNGSCATSSKLMPLTNDKTALKNLINGLQASGSTAGQLGTAWAWYVLSPNFNALWPDASDARPYTELTQLNSKGGPVTQKIAILMTDGDYNTEYWNGINTGYGYSPSNDWSQNQALALCNGMKAKGIIVYTIGAQVSANAKSFLQSCATDVNHYYDATDGNKLTQAFIDIAYKLVPPYLIH